MARKPETPVIRISKQGMPTYYPGQRQPAPDRYIPPTQQQTAVRHIGEVRTPYPLPPQPTRIEKTGNVAKRWGRGMWNAKWIAVTVGAIAIAVPAADKLFFGSTTPAGHGASTESPWSLNFDKVETAQPGEKLPVPNAENTNITIPAGAKEPVAVEVYNGTFEDNYQRINDPIVVRDKDGRVQLAEFQRSGNESVTLRLPFSPAEGTWRTPDGHIDNSHYSAMEATAIPTLIDTANPNDPKHPYQQLYLVDPQHLPEAGTVIGQQPLDGVYDQN